MKLAEFKKVAGSATPVPGGSVEPAAGSAAPSPAEYVTSTTPSGIEVFYSWAPRRHYKLRSEVGLGLEWPEIPEVPSVTTVLGVLDKSGPLTWWGQKVGVEGVCELYKRRLLNASEHLEVANAQPQEATAQEIVDLLVEHKLSVNHVKDSAADRGVNVHGALEAWAMNREIPQPQLWPENEIPYIEGLADFLLAVDPAVHSWDTELMVGSLEHQYAGRFDLVLTLSKPVEVVTRHYPKRADKVEEIPAGRYLMDLKTRKKAAVYNTNYLQLEAYEHAAVECGYAPTDYRAVIVVTEDGGYQVSVNQDWCFEDFLAVRKVYSVLNEREVLRILREELDATEVK